MAGDDSAQEKTEEPTPKKQQKAREDGQVPRSKDLTTTAVLILGTWGLLAFGGDIAQVMIDISHYSFSVKREDLFDTTQMIAHLALSLEAAIRVLLPLFAMLALAAIVGPIALGGWNFSAKTLLPKLNRMDPISGIKRMFSVRSLVELFKSIGKVSIVIFIAVIYLNVNKDELLALSSMAVMEGMSESVSLSLWGALLISCSTIIIAAIDIPFQLWENTKKLRMSRQDIKDEMKDSEGKPEVKSKIRQMQMQMSQNRMMAAVPEADVVITNPTHFSVALKYDPENMRAPILIAKGVDHTALKIREIAKMHKIEFVESPPLARAIYHTTEVDTEVPEGLYVAVAKVLAYVFQLREYRRGRSERPLYPRNPEIPPNYRF